MSSFDRDSKGPTSADPAPESPSSASPTTSPLSLSLIRRRAIQRRAAQQAASQNAAAPPSGAGSPLPGAVQQKMERSFDADFSGVRVHEGEHAGAIGATAYTQGEDVHFAPGQYQPGSAHGQELLGHELTHVVQQRAGRVAMPQGKGAPINADASLEGEADALGAKAARGEAVKVEGSSAGLQRKSSGAPIQRLYDAKHLKGQALDVYGGCLCGDTGLLDKWMNPFFGEAYVYDAEDWKLFLAALDDGKRTVIRKFFRDPELSKVWVSSTLAKLHKVLPEELRTERIVNKPFEGVAPGMPAKDPLNVVYQGGSGRGVEAAQHIVNRKFEKAAMALEGPPLAKDAKARKALIDTFNEKMNAVIDESNRINQALEDSGLGGGGFKPLAHVTYKDDDPAAIDKMLDERFGGKEQSGYLKQLVADGKSNPLWRAKLALGVVQSAWSASEAEVFHIIVDAPLQLEQFKMSWPQFWDPIKDKVKARIKHWNHSSMYERLVAFSNVQLAEEELEEGRKQGEKETHKAGRKVRDARRKEKAAKATGGKELGKASAALKKAEMAAEEKVWEVKKENDKNQHASEERQIEHLVTLIRNTREELNEFDQEAIGELREWAEENAAIRVRTAADPRIDKALKDIKKPRNRAFFKSVILGDSDGSRQKDLEKRGFEHVEHHLDEVVAAEAVVDREKEKVKKKKGKHHTNLKSTLMSMSHDARELYLARAADVSKAELEKPMGRELALVTLGVELEKVGLKREESEELLALFRMKDAGDRYAKLRALVLSNLAWKDEKFGEKALRRVIELEGAEFGQTRADEVVMTALRACPQKKKIEQILGSLDDVAKLDKASSGKARDDAELKPQHWALLLTMELDKTRAPLPKVARQHRNKVHMIAYQAQVAANRNEEQQKAKGKSAPSSAFLKSVAAEMGHKTYFGMFYPTISTAMNAGGPIKVDDVLDEVLFHDGPLRIGGHGGPAFYTHVNKDDFLKTALKCEGEELLKEWSNIADFREGLKEAERRDQGSVASRGQDDEDEPQDAKRNERAFRQQFVLDVRGDRKKLIKKAVGNATAPEVVKKIRERMSEAAAHDPDFKGVLDHEGINSTFHRERMNFRSSLEAAQKRRRGWQLHGVSSKGTADSQNERQEVGDLRRADRDLQSVPITKSGGLEEPDTRIEEQDQLYKEKHQKGLAHDDKALERSGADFTKLRKKIRKYTELAITIAVMVLATAIAAGITAATWGAGAPTLVGVALLWAKFGVMIAAQLTAVAVTAALKQGVGNAITGDEFDGRAMATDIAVGSAGAIAGGATGVGVGGAIEAAHAFTSVAAIEVLKVLATAGAKTVARQGVKGLMEQKRGDVTIMNSLQALINAELASIPAGEIAAALQLEQAAHDAKAHEEAATDHLHEQHDHLGAHEGQHPGETNADQAEHVHDVGLENLHEGSGDLGSADTHLNGTDAATDEAIVAAHTHIAEAQQAMDGHPPDYEAAQEHIAEAQQELETAREHFPEGSEGLHQIDEAQDKLDEASDQIQEGSERLEAAENFESAEAGAKAAELLSAQLAVVGKPVDWTVEQLLDFALDKVEDVAKERINESADLRKEKLAKAKEKKEGTAPSEEAAPHDPSGGGQHAAKSPGHAPTSVVHAPKSVAHSPSPSAKSASKVALASSPKSGGHQKPAPKTSAPKSSVPMAAHASPSAPQKQSVSSSPVLTTTFERAEKQVGGAELKYADYMIGPGFDLDALDPEAKKKKQSVALVNAANSTLNGSAGIAKGLQDAAGNAGWGKDAPKGGLPVGDALGTESGKLKGAGVDQVIHTVGPQTSAPDWKKQIRNCCRRVLEEAAKSKVDSVVFCLISGAIFNDANLPQETIAEEIVQSVEELLQKPTWKDWQFARIIFNNFPGKSMIPGKGGAQTPKLPPSGKSGGDPHGASAKKDGDAPLVVDEGRGQFHVEVTQELVNRYLRDIEKTSAYLNEAEGTILANLWGMKVKTFRQAQAPAKRQGATYIDGATGQVYREHRVVTMGGGDCLIHGLSVIDEGDNADAGKIASARLAISRELGKAEHGDLRQRACELLVNNYIHHDDNQGLGERVKRLLDRDPSVQAAASELMRRAALQPQVSGKSGGGTVDAPSKSADKGGKGEGVKPVSKLEAALAQHPGAATMFPNLVMGDGAEAEACLLNIGGHYIVVVPVRGS